jgi:hypothetical protein
MLSVPGRRIKQVPERNSSRRTSLVIPVNWIDWLFSIFFVSSQMFHLDQTNQSYSTRFSLLNKNDVSFYADEKTNQHYIRKTTIKKRLIHFYKNCLKQNYVEFGWDCRIHTKLCRIESVESDSVLINISNAASRLDFYHIDLIDFFRSFSFSIQFSITGQIVTERHNNLNRSTFNYINCAKLQWVEVVLFVAHPFQLLFNIAQFSVIILKTRQNTSLLDKAGVSTTRCQYPFEFSECRASKNWDSYP